MSVMQRIADSSLTSHQDRDVPESEVEGSTQDHPPSTVGLAIRSPEPWTLATKRRY